MAGNQEKLHTPDNILEIKHVKQFNSASCGAAALEMIYLNLGITDFSHKDFYNEKKTRADYSHIKNRVWRLILEKLYPYSLTMEDIIKDAEEKDLSVEFAAILANEDEYEKYIETIKHLILINKVPFIVRIEPGKSGLDHFVVVVGIDDDNIYYQDPAKENNGQPQSMKINDFIKMLRTNRAIKPGGDLILISKDKIKLAPDLYSENS